MARISFYKTVKDKFELSDGQVVKKNVSPITHYAYVSVKGNFVIERGDYVVLDTPVTTVFNAAGVRYTSQTLETVLEDFK